MCKEKENLKLRSHAKTFTHVGILKCLKRYDSGENKRPIPLPKQIIEFMNAVHSKKQKGKKRRRDANDREVKSSKKIKIEDPSESQEPSPSITPADSPIVSPSQTEKQKKAKVRATNNAKVIKTCFVKIIKKLINKKWKYGKTMYNPFAWPITRENCAALGVPDYFDTIQEAMDLKTIRTKMNNLVYVTHELLARDVRLLVKNAQTYNRPRDPVYKQSEWISQNFEKFYEKEAKKLDDERAARKERKRLKKLEKLKQQQQGKK